MESKNTENRCTHIVSSFSIQLRKYHYDLLQGTSTEDEKSGHMLIACSKFYEKVTYSATDPKRDIIATATVTYIENDLTQKSFEGCKESYKKHEINWDEDYLFHGTDKTKVDSIFTNNFDINSVPVNGRLKVRTIFGSSPAWSPVSHFVLSCLSVCVFKPELWLSLWP